MLTYNKVVQAFNNVWGHESSMTVSSYKMADGKLEIEGNLARTEGKRSFQYLFPSKPQYPASTAFPQRIPWEGYEMPSHSNACSVS